MMLIRPVRADDVFKILDLLHRAGDELNGMSSLRPIEHVIEKRVHLGIDSFAADVSEPGEEVYFFVLEDTVSGRIVGTSALYAAIGLSYPFYSYKVVTRVKSSRELGLYSTIPVLFLTNDYTGCAEVGSLFVDRDYRHSFSGRLASLSRFLFLAEYPKRIGKKVFAEMRGYQEPDGTSPFWEGIGRHFFAMPFPEADEISARGNKQFIAELMPGHPIYVPLLSPAAKAAIGRVHADTEPARRLLEQEGFRYEEYIDIFDGGPTLEAYSHEIRAVRDSMVAQVQIGAADAESVPLIVARRSRVDFRAIVTRQSSPDGDTISLHPDAAARLGVTAGDSVRYVAAHAPPAP